MTASHFCFKSFDFSTQTGRATFHYEVDHSLSFTEVVTFPQAPFHLSFTEKKALDTVLFLAHIALGISYYKAFLPANIEIKSGVLSFEEASFFNQFYLKGLGEFAIRNQLNLQGKINFPFQKITTNSTPLDFQEKAFIPIGGGKDSCVVIELVKTLKIPSTVISCGTSAAQTACANISGLPYAIFSRDIDSKLMELNKSTTVYNGHVPITGILAFLLWIFSILTHTKYVVMGCEKSANTGNLMQGTLNINHQWSKSFEFEQLFHQLTEHITPGFQYFSLLRPLSEVHIAALFAEKCASYFYDFTSCNKAFKLDLSQRLNHWCANCDKCRFVFLILAPFMDKEILVKVIGKNLLNDSSQIMGYQELLGLSGHKPFECVGEPQECCWAFNQLKHNPTWQNDCVIQKLNAPLQASPFNISCQHFIPQEFVHVLELFKR